MPRLLPPIDKRFPVNRPHAPNAGNKGPYLACLLRRLLEKKIKYIAPGTNKKITGSVKDALIWRLILNGTEGETTAIKEILERIDGKVEQKLLNELSGEVKIMETIKIDGIELTPDVGNK